MSDNRRGPIIRLGVALVTGIYWLAAALFALWAFGALWYDFPLAPRWVAGAFAVVLVVLLVQVQGGGSKAVAWVVAAGVVLAWWLTLQPRQDRNWQPDVAQTAWADINGDEITLHNVRNCDYRTASDYTPRWEKRTVHLSKLSGIDLAIAYWGSPYMAHPIASFQFADGPPLCFSIETRKEVGESYSAIGGFFRQFELIYIVATEADVIRLRTKFRTTDVVYLYRLTITPEKARGRFMDYLAALNQLRDTPRWYNAATTNCTTSIRTQRDATARAPWDWRILVNGKADGMLYERGAFVTGGLGFPELRAAARINEDILKSEPGADYSVRIRKDRPGFAAPTPAP